MKIFKELGLGSNITSVVTDLGFVKPTEIQAKSIPYILQGKDVIGESETGSGKTLAFASGVIEKTIPNQGVQALILEPTRELAEQVRESIEKFSNRTLTVVSIYGGVNIRPQMDNLRKADVVVATPGRTLDHLQRNTIDLSRVKVLVLDEADRMLDMGFVDDVEEIIDNCPKNRQTLFFSATVSQQIRNLATKYTNEAIKVFAKNQVDPKKLKQVYYDVTRNLKLSLLIYLLKNEKAGLAMVFCNTRRNANFVVKNLKANKVDAVAIHGGLSQNSRTKTLDMFNRAKFGVLVCTDVAARGLHIDNVSHIYNYDLPKDSKDYVHRIGRTARAGEEGKVINVLSESDYDNFARIQRDYREFKVEKMERPFLDKINFIGNESRPRRNSGFRNGRKNFGPRRFNRSRKPFHSRFSKRPNRFSNGSE